VLAKVISCAVVGLEGVPVEVEIAISQEVWTQPTVDDRGIRAAISCSGNLIAYLRRICSLINLANRWSAR
jgi:hypothetical protein